MSLATGERIGPYEVVGVVGAGGMGEVYQARDSRLDRTVAIKILPREVALDANRRARFEREAKTIAGLTHPHICTLHDVGEYEGLMFLVMEHLSGETLASRLRKGPLPLEDALTVASEIADALVAAHKHGVIHCDLKPSNVMLTNSGVKLLDFGVAKLFSDDETAGAEASTITEAFSTGVGRVLGTVPYMSPEQLRGDRLDSRTDLFSLGVVLYEMTTGRHPFAGDSSFARMASILDTTPLPATAVDPRLPEQVDRILRHALAKHPDRRYQTAQDVQNDLEDLKREIYASGGGGSTSTARSWIPLVVTLAAVVAIVATAGVWSRTRLSAERRSIAVLPLVNLSDDPETEYFSDGISQDIIAALSKLGDLRVIATTSAARYKNSRKSGAEIGRELGVATLVEGSVRRAGDRVRIVSELVDAATGQQLWADTYDRELKDIFAIQTDVARRIAMALKGELSPADSARLAAGPVVNVEAFNLYLRGRYYWNQRSHEGLLKAIEYFQRATAIDPDYALAYSGLADSYNLLAQYGFQPSDQVRPLARDAAARALALDPTLAEAHASQALIEHARFGWSAAGDEFRRALVLNPNYATAHHWYANYLAQLGQFDDALAEIKRARQLDPLSIGINAGLGAVLYLARRYDEAAVQLRTTIEMEPKFVGAHGALAEVCIQQRAYVEADEQYRTVTALAGDTPEVRASLAYLYAVSGRPSEARQILADLERLPGPEAPGPVSLAVAYAGLGQEDKAFTWLDEAYARRDAWLVFLKVEPKFDNLRSDPRFDLLLRHTGLER